MNTQYKIFDNRPYILWGRVYTKHMRNILSIDAQQEIAEYFIGRRAEKIFFDEDAGPDLNDCKNLWLAIEYAKTNNYLFVIAKVSGFRNIDDALRIVDELGEKNIFFCDVPFMDRFALKFAFELFERQTLIKGIHTKLGLRLQQKSLKENGFFINKRGVAVNHLGREKGYTMDAARAAAYESRMQKKNEWRENSPAWQWVKSQIVKNRGTREILEDFLELAKLQPEVYCTRTGKPMTLPKLSQWKRQILEDIEMESISNTSIEGEFAVIERKSDAVEFTINYNSSSELQPASSHITINQEKLRIFEQQTETVKEILSNIFTDEDAESSVIVKPYNNTGAWMEILNTLLTKEVWQRAEVDSMCKERGLMLGAVLEQINDYAYEKVDDAVIEDDGDNIYVTLDYKEELI